MQKDLIGKIQRITHRGPELTEDEVRSLAIMTRKCIEMMEERDRMQYRTLNLFCNWAAHIEITESMTGLRTLARVNDALVRVKEARVDEIQREISQALGFGTLYVELTAFLDNTGITHSLDDAGTWNAYLKHLVEIIRDVPIAFPPVDDLRPPARRVYEEIIRNPIKSGAGVVSITLTNVDYGELGAHGFGELLCLLIQMEDTTSVVVPLMV